MVNFARSLIEWMGGVVRDSGEDEVLESRKNRRGKKQRKTGGALGSEYGALDFRQVTVAPFSVAAYRQERAILHFADGTSSGASAESAQSDLGHPSVTLAWTIPVAVLNSG